MKPASNLEMLWLMYFTIILVDVQLLVVFQYINSCIVKFNIISCFVLIFYTINLKMFGSVVKLFSCFS